MEPNPDSRVRDPILQILSIEPVQHLAVVVAECDQQIQLVCDLPPAGVGVGEVFLHEVKKLPRDRFITIQFPEVSQSRVSNHAGFSSGLKWG